MISPRFVKSLKVDLTDITPPSVALFTPFPGQIFIPLRAIILSSSISGTISTQPSFSITNGTDDILGAGENANDVEGQVTVFNFDGGIVADHSNPLTLTKTVAAAGTTPGFTVDIFIEGIVYPQQ